MIQLNKNKKEPIDGYDKLDSRIFLLELDCMNNTSRRIKFADYDDHGKVLEEYDYSDPEVQQIRPGSIAYELRRKVCPK